MTSEKNSQWVCYHDYDYFVCYTGGTLCRLGLCDMKMDSVMINVSLHIMLVFLVVANHILYNNIFHHLEGLFGMHPS